MFARIAYSEKHNLCCDVVIPDSQGPAPTLVLLHGGGWKSKKEDRKEQLPVAYSLAAEGFASVAIDYRGAPEFRFSAQMEDISAAIAFVVRSAEQYGFAPGSIAVSGLSAGGHLAATAAILNEQLHLGIKCAVSFQGPLDLVAYSRYDLDHPKRWAERLVHDLVGGPIEDLPSAAASASPLHLARSNSAPLLAVAFKGDLSVPYQYAEALVEKLTSMGVCAQLLLDDRDWHAEVSPEEIGKREWPDMWNMERPAKLVFHSQVVSFLKRQLQIGNALTAG